MGLQDLQMSLGWNVLIAGGNPSPPTGTNPETYLHLTPSSPLSFRRSVADVDILHLHSLFRAPALGALTLAPSSVAVAISYRGQLDVWSMASGRSTAKRAVTWGLARESTPTPHGCHFTTPDERRQVLRTQLGQAWSGLPSLTSPNPIRIGMGESWRRHTFSTIDGPRLLFLGRLHPKKQTLELIAALSNYRHHRWTLTIAGPAESVYATRVREAVGDYGLAHRIEIVGPVFGEEKDALFEKHDVLLAPSRQENFGNVLYEALAHGLWVATTKGIDGWRDLEERAGALVAAPTLKGIEAILARIFSDPEAYLRPNARGKSWVLEYLDPSRLRRDWLQFYRAMIGERPV